VACFPTPGRTAAAVSAAVHYAEFVERMDDVAVFNVRGVVPWPAIDGALSEAGARAYLAPLGIPSPPERLVHSLGDAIAAWQALGSGAVAVKVQSPELAHKAAIGGVRLNVETADDMRDAYDSVLGAALGLSVEGVLVQAMAPPGGVEVIVAARREPLLAPLVVVGSGGVGVEAEADVAMRLAPVSSAEAEAMLGELRIADRLREVDVDALITAVVRISELAATLASGVQTVELNPLLVLDKGVLMLDAAIEMEAPNDDAD
jgi:acetate---CoA ligase (ADP-forming)